MIRKIELPNLKIEQLYIKWNEKIAISAKNITLLKEQKDENSPIDFEHLKKVFDKVQLLHTWFEDITFSNITYRDIPFSFSYNESKGGKLHASSALFDLETSFGFDTSGLTLWLESLHLKQQNIRLAGQALIRNDFVKNTAFLQIFFEERSLFDLHATSNAQNIHYALHAKEPITDYKKLINLFTLHHELRYWVDDAIDVDALELLVFEGSFSLNEPQTFLKKLHAKAFAHKLSYKYDKNLDPIVSRVTELEFQDAVLHIRPQDAFSYGFNLGASHLLIDFNPMQELLTLYLRFEGKLNENVLAILKNYHIKLPFLQNKGNITTDLKLDVNLHTIDVEAIGKFSAKTSNFNFFNLNFDVAEAEVLLHNYDVKVIAKKADYLHIANADLKASFNAQSEEGDISFYFNSIVLPEYNLALNNTKPLQATYRLAKGNDTIFISPSLWQLGTTALELSSASILFDFHTLEAKLPKMLLQVPDKASITFEGEGSLAKKELALRMNLTRLFYDTLKLKQNYTPLQLYYKNESLQITSDGSILLDLEGKPLALSKTKISLKDDTVTLFDTAVAFDSIAQTKISGTYSLAEDFGTFNVNDTILSTKENQTVFTHPQTLDFQIKRGQNTTATCQAEQLALSCTYGNEGWALQFADLSKIASFAPIFQEYNLTNGVAEVSKKHDQEKIDFSLQTNYPYTLLHAKDTHIQTLTIHGSHFLQEEKTQLSINDRVKILFDQSITVETQQTGFDLFALLDFLEKITPKEKTKKTIPFSLHAKDVYLYLNKERRILADTLELTHQDDVLEATLQHKNGDAYLSYDEHKQFLLHGEGFGDLFMEHLFAYSKFKDANLSFMLNGNLKDFKGVFYLKDTTIKDYKIINNVLAFVNTIPSLVTFSLPGYNTKGLFVTEGYVKFDAKELAFNISDININSKELSILGKGIIDYNKNNVDLELNLKTDLGSSASKIPIIGYILFDKESVATTLSVQGTLQDPQVSSLLAKEIIVAPLNIIKRTFLLPFQMFKEEEER